MRCFTVSRDRDTPSPNAFGLETGTYTNTEGRCIENVCVCRWPRVSIQYLPLAWRDALNIFKSARKRNGGHSPCVRNGRVRVRYYNITAIGLQAPNSLAMLAKITRAQTRTHTFLYDISSSYFIRFSERAHTHTHIYVCTYARTQHALHNSTSVARVL